MSKQWAMAILFVIVVAGVGLRSYHLMARSLWFDEAFSWRLIQFPWQEMISRAAQDVHPPLYYILLKGWRYVFASSLVSLRSFSITWAAITIVFVYLFTSLAVRSRATGLLAAALTALSPWQIQFAWEARMYTLGTALTMVSVWLLIKAVRGEKIANWFFYGLAAAALAYVHYYAFFSIAAQLLFVAGYLIVVTRGRPGEIIQSRIFWGCVLAVLVMTATFAPWLKTFLAQNAQVQTSYWIPKIGGWSIPDTFYRMLAPTPGIPPHNGWWFWLALAPLVGTLCLWGWLLVLAKGRGTANKLPHDAAWLIVLSGFVPFIASIVLSFSGQSLYQDRFFVFAQLFILIGLAVFIGQIPMAHIKRLAALVVTVAFFVSYVSFWNQLDIVHKPGSQAATKTIYENIKPDEVVMVSSPFVYFSVLHYAQEEWLSTTAPKLYSESGQLAHFAGGPILMQGDVVGSSLFSQSRKIWVVDTTGFGSTKLQMPPGWKQLQSESFPEVYSYQGEVTVTEYEK